MASMDVSRVVLPSPHICICPWHFVDLNTFIYIWRDSVFLISWRIQRWHTRTSLKDFCFYSIIIYILYSLWTCAASIFPGIIVENEICYLFNYTWRPSAMNIYYCLFMIGDYPFNFYTSEWLWFEFTITTINKEEYGIRIVFVKI